MAIDANGVIFNPIELSGEDHYRFVENPDGFALSGSVNGQVPDNLSETSKPQSKKPKAAIAFSDSQTEVENARRFAAEHCQKIGYVHPWKKWYVFTGKRWEPDTAGHAIRLAKQTAAKILQEAVDSASQGAIRFATATCSSRGINAMLALAQCELALDYQMFDADPFLFNCENGTIDVRTGILRPHDRADLLTKISPAKYDPNAQTHEWERFVESLFDSQSQVDYLRRFAGYCLTGDVREQILSIPHGVGSNGKSVYFESFAGMLGPDYAMTAPSDLLMESRNDRHPTEKADLFKMRLVVAAETEANRELAESLVKVLTGGDKIRARRMHQDHWEFEPTHKIVLLTNHKPVIKGQDHGIWRRLRLVPFIKQFWDADKGETGPAELKADKTLPERLKGLKDSILTWAVRGCLEWQSEGLGTSDEIQAATAEYKSESDVIGRFVEQCCLTNSSVSVKASAFNEALEAFCLDTGDRKPSPKEASAWLKNKFEKKTSNGVWYIGIGLKYTSEES